MESTCGCNRAGRHTGTAKKKEGEENKKLRATDTMDLDASQWLKGVDKQGKFDGGLIAK